MKCDLTTDLITNFKNLYYVLTYNIAIFNISEMEYSFRLFCMKIFFAQSNCCQLKTFSLSLNQDLYIHRINAFVSGLAIFWVSSYPTWDLDAHACCLWATSIHHVKDIFTFYCQLTFLFLKCWNNYVTWIKWLEKIVISWYNIYQNKKQSVLPITELGNTLRDDPPYHKCII